MGYKKFLRMQQKFPKSLVSRTTVDPPKRNIQVCLDFDRIEVESMKAGVEVEVEAEVGDQVRVVRAGVRFAPRDCKKASK